MCSVLIQCGELCLPYMMLTWHMHPSMTHHVLRSMPAAAAERNRGLSHLPYAHQQRAAVPVADTGVPDCCCCVLSLPAVDQRRQHAAGMGPAVHPIPPPVKCDLM
jgi:hypothetical protein